MVISQKEFHDELFQDILRSAQADGVFTEDTFFERFCAELVDAGELETADRAQFDVKGKGIRVDGYGGDPITSGGTLSLIIADFNQSPELKTLTQTNMNDLFKRVEKFLARSLEIDFRSELEESSPAFGLADLIAKRWIKVSKVRLLLITNKMLSARVDGRASGEFDGVPITYNVWDIGRLHRFVASGHGREDIEIDLVKEFGGALPVLPVHIGDAGYKAYLTVIPGDTLAAVYDRWGARLLEQNVRVFLQARNNVNKGIKNTIENDPGMFFAFNNGITATAEGVVTEKTSRGLELTQLRNLQIVNGGQTTASIHAESRRKGGDLSQVFVQMKLSVVEPAVAVDIVPRISEYANTQNRVNAADFFANHPFHVRIEEFSRRMYAPAADGTFVESKWFYERARGQYRDARAHLSVTQRNRFDQEYPKRQLFTKTDLAKFLNVWQGLPHVVSQGAQKNFANFAAAIGKDWTRAADSFNETYYRHAIAKAMIFREVERLVTAQPWYSGGYRANIVAYAIAKLAYDAESENQSINFDAVWRRQSVTAGLRDALTKSAEAVHHVIINPPAGTSNISEWAKMQACWQQVKDLKIQWPDTWAEDLMSEEEKKNKEHEAKRDQRILNGIQAQTAVVQAGPEFWRDVLDWGRAKELLSSMEVDILQVATSMPNRIPSEKQSMRTIETLRKLRDEGCQMSLDGI